MVEYQLPGAGRRQRVGRDLEAVSSSHSRMGKDEEMGCNSMGSGAISFLKALVGTLASFFF